MSDTRWLVTEGATRNPCRIVKQRAASRPVDL